MKPTIWTDRALLLVRIALGIVFVMHGAQKLFVFGHAGTTALMSQVGVPVPGVSAVLITATELGGGLALLLGAFTRVASALIAFAMLVAILTVHLPNGFFLPTGYEYALTNLLVSLSLTMAGAGAYSMDARRLSRRTGRVEVRVAPRRAA
jgi:putative oxidoreductase